MRFKFIVISVLLLIAGYGVFWYKMASDAEKMTLDWIERSQQNTGGLTAYVEDVKVSGFPYKIIIKASSVKATLTENEKNPVPITLSAPEVNVVFQPWKPNHAIVLTEYLDATLGDFNRPDTSLMFNKIKSSVILEQDTQILKNLSIVAEKINWHEGAISIDDQSSILENAEFHLRKSVDGFPQENSYDLPVNRLIYFKADTAKIDEFKSTILGDKSDEVIIEAILHANEQPEFTIPSLSKWRDEGGTLTIRTFKYGTEEAGLELSGDVTLDENLKPLGAFDAKIKGTDGIVGALSQDENMAQMVQLFLQGLSTNSEGTSDIPISISMQNGYLYLGIMPVLELDPLIMSEN